MSEPSFSAADAARGFGVPGAFPYLVLGGEAKRDGRTGEVEGHPVFEAYARRSAPAGRTARQALVLALADGEGQVEKAAGKEDFSSYGVTSAPFAAPPKQAPAIRLARKPKMAAEPRMNAVPASVTAAPLMPLMPAPASSQSTAPITSVEASPAASGEAVPGKLKVALRRPSLGSTPATPATPAMPTAPEAPLFDAPFLMGPVMDGTRAPLVPIPSVAGVAPFPAPVVDTGAGLAESDPAPAPSSGSAVAGSVKAASTERQVWWGRVAVAVVAMAFLVLGASEWQQRGFWPFQAKADVAMAGGASVAPFWTVEVTSGRPAGTAGPAAVAAVAAERAAERPAAAKEFVQLVERYRITGVLQTSPARAIIDGRIVEAGELVDVAREIRLVGLDTDNHLLIFEDRTTARATVRY